MIKGFHVCKAGNAPTVGQVKSLIVNGDRIKSKKVEEGGQNYTIVSVAQRESYSDSYGNVGYDIAIEPQNGAPRAQVAPQRAAATGWSDDRGNRIERQHSQEMAIRYAALKGLKDITPHDMVALIDWFARDVGRMPAPPSAKPEPAPEHDDAPEPDEEEAF